VVGGVRVSPRDWIVGDYDVLVVIAGDSVETILREAEAKVSTENEIRDAVRDGMMPREAYERFGTF
jgi:4-hydroxy-4-methyl-2-oxoglutarate aldolase